MDDQTLEDRLRGLIVDNRRTVQHHNTTIPQHQLQPQQAPPPGNRPPPLHYQAAHGVPGPRHPHQQSPRFSTNPGPPLGSPRHDVRQQFAHPPRSPLDGQLPMQQHGAGAHGPRFPPPGIHPQAQPQNRQNRHPQAHRPQSNPHWNGYGGARTMPNMADFPPLGSNGPLPKPAPLPPNSQFQRGNAQAMRQQVHVGRQHVENTQLQGVQIRRVYPRQPQQPQQAFKQFYPEQAANLGALSQQVLAEATPPATETEMKRQLLERLENLCKELDPHAHLIPFGSLVTGFATASSDIDCVFTTDAEDTLVAVPDHDETSDEGPISLPERLQKKLEDEGFGTTLLTRTRIPIIKLVQKPTELYPVELQCDIGFKNQLAIHNTHLLQSYALCDKRVRPMVLFVKWWTKKRHINSPYRGTLSSYGYVLMVIHYLTNIVEPPVLANLQLLKPPANVRPEHLKAEDAGKEYNIWFERNVSELAPSKNVDSLGELLRGFFDYYAFQFQWGHTAIAIRREGGIVTKEEKDWVAAKSRPGNDTVSGETWEVKDRYLLAIEDPFEISHNVGRTCTGSGMYRIRDEFRRAMKLIKIRNGGKTLRDQLFVEAPPEKPFVRRKDKKDADAATPPHDDEHPAAEDGAAPPEIPTDLTQGDSVLEAKTITPA